MVKQHLTTWLLIHHISGQLKYRFPYKNSNKCHKDQPKAVKCRKYMIQETRSGKWKSSKKYLDEYQPNIVYDHTGM